MTSLAIVIADANEGVFLGMRPYGPSWSQMDVFAGDCAMAFRTVEEAERFLDMCKGHRPRDSFRMVPVCPDHEHDGTPYASMEACVAAGIRPWLGLDSSTGNSLPI